MSHDLVRGILKNNHGSISKAITLIENSQLPPEPFFSDIHKNAFNSIRIGITGPPGAGKSTLTNSLIEFCLSAGKEVGVIAVDPTSPFSFLNYLRHQLDIFLVHYEYDLFLDVY